MPWCWPDDTLLKIIDFVTFLGKSMLRKRKGTTALVDAMILSFIDEHNLSFSVAHQIIRLIKECAADSKALTNVARLGSLQLTNSNMVCPNFFKEA